MNPHFAQIRHFLTKVDVEALISRIEKFRSTVDFKTISNKDLREAIYEVMSADIDGRKVAFLFPRASTYTQGTRFYRIRILPLDDRAIPPEIMKLESDAWAPPAHIVTKMGRLNQVGESLLYTTPITPVAAVDECKVQDNELFCLIVYKAIRPIRVNMIGIWRDIPGFTPEENIKMRVITNFLKDEFSKEVGIGTEHLYRASERIAKDWFDLPAQEQDAWCYPSIAKRGLYNVCFRAKKAKESLSLVGVQICSVEKRNGNYMFQCRAVAIGFNDAGCFNYYPVYSQKVRDVFPEIIIGDPNNI